MKHHSNCSGTKINGRQNMKKVATLLTFLCGLDSGLAQGVFHNPGVVTFQNSETARPSGQPATFHLIYDYYGNPVVGTQNKAELYYLDTTTTSLTPIAASISSFKSTTATKGLGTWVGPSAPVNLPAGYGGVDFMDDGNGTGTFVEAGDGSGTGPGYYPVTLIVRVWDSTTGSSWETATLHGQTSSFSYTQRYHDPSLLTDTEMINQPGIGVPEPGAIALGVLGIAGLLLFRGRKFVVK
jgi:hypothetical protein